MTQNAVIPTGAERSEAQWKDLFCRCIDKTGGSARDDGKMVKRDKPPRPGQRPRIDLLILQPIMTHSNPNGN
jgi:hypothetical protein